MRRLALPALLLIAAAGLTRPAPMALLLNTLLYFPTRGLEVTPSQYGLQHADLGFQAEDGVRLHGWWITAAAPPSRAHVLFFHGNGGNISHRLGAASELAAAGLDVLLFDYRGYGRSGGRPDEPGTYRDARAARQALLSRPGADPDHLFYLGESLGGAVALALAMESPPRGLILQAAFASVKDMARLHYPFIPPFMVPDAYPSLQRIGALRAPLLVIHGERDDIVPLSQGQALYAAAPGPKSLHVVRGGGHNDLLEWAGDSYAEVIASWVGRVLDSPASGGPS